MHVTENRRAAARIAAHRAGNTWESWDSGPNIDWGAVLKSHDLDPALANQLVVMGLMHEVDTFPSQFTGEVHKNDQVIAQPYLLDWVDKGTQDIVKKSAA